MRAPWQQPVTEVLHPAPNTLVIITHPLHQTVLEPQPSQLSREFLTVKVHRQQLCHVCLRNSPSTLFPKPPPDSQASQLSKEFPSAKVHWQQLDVTDSEAQDAAFAQHVARWEAVGRRGSGVKYDEIGSVLGEGWG